MTPKCRRVAVIGAGVSGLAAIKSCLEEGMDVLAYESRPCSGGLWTGVKDKWTSDGPCMYPSLVTNTSKSMMCYSDFPCPPSYPPYLPYPLYNDYLHLYAQQFHLEQYINFKTRVTHIRRSADHQSTGRWTLTIETCGGQRLEETFDGVIVCAGFYSKAWMPEVPGLSEKFRGRVSHAKDYQDSAPYVGRRVLVVGNASSAGDIACDLSTSANQVYLSVGDGCCVVRRTSPSCLPPDMGIKRIFTELLSPETIMGIIQRVANRMFDHKKTGLWYTRSRKTDCPFVVSDGLPVHIMTGKVKVIPRVSKYNEHGFSTVDGIEYSEIDDVIFATGYSKDLSILDESLGCNGEKMYLYKHVFPLEEKYHTLALVGCIRAVGPMPPTLELQARLAAYTLSGRHQLPAYDVMRADVEYFNKLALKPDGSYKYSFLGMFIADNVASEIGVKPRFWELVLSGRPKLAFKCFFGTAFPFQYRIRGPGQWSGAVTAMNSALKENLGPLQNRVLDLQTKKSFTLYTMLKVLFLLSALVFVASHVAGGIVGRHKLCSIGPSTGNFKEGG